MTTEAAIVYENARRIISQKVIATTKELPNLPEHQQAAKEKAHKFNDEIWPPMKETIFDVIDYAKTFQCTHKNLVKLIPQFDHNDRAEKAHRQLLQCLKQVLIPALQEKKYKAVAIASQVYKFHDEFEKIYRSINLAVDDVVTKDEEEIRDKQAELVKNKAGLYGWAACGAGAAVPITAGVMIKAATVTAAATTTTTTTFAASAATASAAAAATAAFPVVAVVGSLLIIGEIATVGYAYTRYKTEKTQANQLSSEIGALKTEVDQLRLIQTCSQQIVESSAKLVELWTAMEHKLKAIVVHLEKAKSNPADAAIVIETELDTAKDTWKEMEKELLDQSKSLITSQNSASNNLRLREIITKSGLQLFFDVGNYSLP